MNISKFYTTRVLELEKASRKLRRPDRLAAVQYILAEALINVRDTRNEGETAKMAAEFFNGDMSAANLSVFNGSASSLLTSLNWTEHKAVKEWALKWFAKHGIEG